MKQPVLEVNNLSITFGTGGHRTATVKNLSFSIQPGKIMALVGESGSGKSMTALAMMGLLPGEAAASGQVMLHGKQQSATSLLPLDATGWRNIRGNDIAMIFQEPMTALNPVHTCGSQVIEAIQLHQQISYKAARANAIALFEKVQLPDPAAIMDRYPHQLSGGQKQRVMIAMAISCHPSLLIADEPTTALDVTVQHTIVTLIKELQLQNQMSILFITHDLGLVADIADEVAVMYKGELIEQGPVEKVLSNPAQDYTRALLNCRPSLHQKGEPLPVVADILHSTIPKNVALNTSYKNDDPCIQPAALPPAPLLSVSNVHVHYPGKKQLFGKTTAAYKAVDGVSFNVYKGETLGIVGESGCGKTTLGRAILQLIPVTAGEIILNGTNLATLNKQQLLPLRKDLQIVFQDPFGSLNPRISIGDAIMEPMKVHQLADNQKARKEKAIELLEKVNLHADQFNRYPHQFSGGQRQRICIARALALHPSFLIFDESVSALDVSVQAQVLNLLSDLKKTFQFTSIFISHDLSVIKYVSDRVLVMQKGKIVESGTCEEVYEHPQQAYTRQLINAIPGKALQKLPLK